MSKALFHGRFLALAGALALLAGTAQASPDYSGCEECHGIFNLGFYTSLVDGTAWGGSLMDTHVDWVGGECQACHMILGPGSLYMASSGNDVLSHGCVGCHGREADETGVCTGLSSDPRATAHCGAGAGLRAVHERALGVGTCTSCHGSDPVPAGEDEPAWNHLLMASAVRDACNSDGSEARLGNFGLDNDGDGLRDGDDPDCQFPINAGLNDAWYNPDTSGQGFLITVLGDVVFLAWFTYDVAQPPDGVTAVVGHPGHRWLTAQGPFEGDTAVLTVNLSQGGAFDAAQPAVGRPTAVGEITLTWQDCRNATLAYVLDGVGENVINIRRISPANIPLCEMLAADAAAE